ncbi:MAG: pilus assembly protein TadG-related protein [Acidimicrobiia bacterium]
MRRLRTGRDEAGVTMVLVAAFIVVAMAMAALVVDVGALVYERRELQNGADAVALSVAQSCALAEPSCSSGPTDSVLSQLAGDNAVDDATTIESVQVDTAARTVTVGTRTLTDSGSGILPFNFAAGGKTVHATSVATWGAPQTATVIPLGISLCEWEGVQLDVETTTIFHRPDASPCAGPSGADIAGGFGWLDPVAGTCHLELSAGGVASAKTGAPVPASCDFGTLLGKELLVPIFDAITFSGTIARYHVVGFAAFKLTGYRFPATNSTPRPCSPPKTCVSGIFTHFVESSGGPIGGGEFGVSIVKLVS